MVTALTERLWGKVLSYIGNGGPLWTRTRDPSLIRIDEYLFSVNRSDASHQHRSRRFFEDRLSELCKQADIKRITPHQLRHYFATHTLSHGADIKAVSEMLGYADVDITLKIYHHVNAKSIMQMHREYSPLATTSFA
jgi:site-specific recombinase XerD